MVGARSTACSRGLVAVAALVASVALLAAPDMAAAQDPAGSWLAYAVQRTANNDRIQTFYAETVVPTAPVEDGAQPAFWIGIEPKSNLNLLQPIIPKWTGDAYYIWVEHFDWRDFSDWQSEHHPVNPGDRVWGSLSYDASNNMYNMSCGSYTDGYSFSKLMQLDGDQVMSNAYVVIEHQPSDCAQYPPDNMITYTKIKTTYKGGAQPMAWKPVVFQTACDAKAVVNSPTSVSLEWKS